MCGYARPPPDPPSRLVRPDRIRLEEAQRCRDLLGAGMGLAADVTVSFYFLQPAGAFSRTARSFFFKRRFFQPTFFQSTVGKRRAKSHQPGSASNLALERRFTGDICLSVDPAVIGVARSGARSDPGPGPCQRPPSSKPNRNSGRETDCCAAQQSNVARSVDRHATIVATARQDLSQRVPARERFSQFVNTLTPCAALARRMRQDLRTRGIG